MESKSKLHQLQKFVSIFSYEYELTLWLHFLSNNVTVQQATSAYIDDIFINNSVPPAEQMRHHFLWFGLESKDLEQFEDGARVLVLEVWGEHGTL